jgi:riboflavin synthase
VVRSEGHGENWFLDVLVAPTVLPFIWKKGSITLNGVSLTVNEVLGTRVSVGLIPETVKRTNLGLLKVGDHVNVEPDYMAKALQRMLETQKESGS